MFHVEMKSYAKHSGVALRFEDETDVIPWNELPAPVIRSICVHYVEWDPCSHIQTYNGALYLPPSDLDRVYSHGTARRRAPRGVLPHPGDLLFGSLLAILSTVAPSVFSTALQVLGHFHSEMTSADDPSELTEESVLRKVLFVLGRRWPSPPPIFHLALPGTCTITIERHAGTILDLVDRGCITTLALAYVDGLDVKKEHRVAALSALAACPATVEIYVPMLSDACRLPDSLPYLVNAYAQLDTPAGGQMGAEVTSTARKFQALIDSAPHLSELTFSGDLQSFKLSFPPALSSLRCLALCCECYSWEKLLASDYRKNFDDVRDALTPIAPQLESLILDSFTFPPHSLARLLPHMTRLTQLVYRNRTEPFYQTYPLIEDDFSMISDVNRLVLACPASLMQLELQDPSDALDLSELQSVAFQASLTSMDILLDVADFMDVRYLASLTRLQALMIDHCRMVPEVLKAAVASGPLGPLPLRALSLYKCKGVSAAVIESLAACSRTLIDLDLDGCVVGAVPDSDDDASEASGGGGEAEPATDAAGPASPPALVVADTTEDFIAALSKLSRLRHLGLYGYEPFTAGHGVTPQHILQLTGLRALRTVSLKTDVLAAEGEERSAAWDSIRAGFLAKRGAPARIILDS